MKSDHKYGWEGYMVEEIESILRDWERYAHLSHSTRVYFCRRIYRSTEFYVRNIFNERQNDDS
jgi:hypothetical protein